MNRTFPRKGRVGSPIALADVAALTASLVTVLGSLPAHSESWYQPLQHLIRQFVQVTLVFLGLATPPVQPFPAQIVLKAPAPVRRVVQTPAPTTLPNAMFLRREPVLRRYTYIFEGKATHHGQPYANASVLVRLMSGETSVTKGTVTEADGSYTIEVTLNAAPDSPVDWTMEAFTPDFKKVEFYGRKIVSREENVVIVQNPLEFLAALPK